VLLRLKRATRTVHSDHSLGGIPGVILLCKLKEGKKSNIKSVLKLLFHIRTSICLKRSVFQRSPLHYRKSQTSKKVNIDKVGEITSDENFVNIQMITSRKPFINPSGFCSLRIRTAFFRECSRLAGMHLCIDQHKVIKGVPVEIKTICRHNISRLQDSIAF